MAAQPDDLTEVIEAYRVFGFELQRMPADERRRMIATIVRTLGETCPVAVADLAACASMRLVLGGAR